MRLSIGFIPTVDREQQHCTYNVEQGKDPCGNCDFNDENDNREQETLEDTEGSEGAGSLLSCIPTGVGTVPPSTPRPHGLFGLKELPPPPWGVGLLSFTWRFPACRPGCWPEVFLEPLAGAPLHAQHFLGTRETYEGTSRSVKALCIDKQAPVGKQEGRWEGQKRGRRRGGEAG